MTDTTSRLKLPYIAAAQAQKHVTHNEALLALDLLAQISVLNRDLNEAPAAAVEGDCHIVGSTPSGIWEGHGDELAIWQDGHWVFRTPNTGWLAWVADEANCCVFDGSAWRQAPNWQEVPHIGVNTTSDPLNRFAVKSASTLFEHDGDDHRLKISKSEPTATASILFQTASLGHAEFGLAGNNDFRLKTSADGSFWNDSLLAESSTGSVAFPAGVMHLPSGQRLCQLLPSPSVPEIWRMDSERGATPRTYSVASVSGQEVTLTAPVAGEIFRPSMRGVSMVRIWNVSKSPAQSAWIERDNSSTQLRVLDAADIAGWSAGETLQLGDPTPTDANVLGMIALDISPFIQSAFGATFAQRGCLVATCSAATGGDAALSVSGSGATGSVLGTTSLATGAPNYASTTVFTPTASPVSNTNLFYVRESLVGASALGLTYVRLLGLYV